VNSADKHFLRALNELQKNIFDIYIKRDYVEHHLQRERLLYEKNLAILKIFQRLREEKNPLLSLYEQSYEVMLDLGLLRYRVQEAAVLEMCYQEFAQISAAISISLETLQISPALESHIFAFETLYQNTLNVVAKFPIVFAIFIENLFLFDRLLKNIFQTSKPNP